MHKPALMALSLLGLGLGYVSGWLASDQVSGQAGGTPYAAATLSQPTGGWATDGTQGNPVLDASRHRDGVDPDPQNPTNVTEAKVAYGLISYNSSDTASAGDGRQVLYGTLHNVPAGANYGWHVDVTVYHNHLARAVNAPGNPGNQTWYKALAMGQVHVDFSILDAAGRPLSPDHAVSVVDTRQAERANPLEGDDSVDSGEFQFDQVLSVAAGDNKAKLVLKVNCSVQLNAHRPEVDVGGNARMSIKPGGKIRAYDYANPLNPVKLKKSDGTDAEWALE